MAQHIQLTRMNFGVGFTLRDSPKIISRSCTRRQGLANRYQRAPDREQSAKASDRKFGATQNKSRMPATKLNSLICAQCAPRSPSLACSLPAPFARD